MPFRRKILYYGLMLALTLLALEGMARIAYYAAYGAGYGGGRSADPDNLTPPPPLNISAKTNAATEYAAARKVSHPFYGLADPAPGNALNARPPRQRQGDTVVVGLLGGSVAQEVAPFLQTALERWFAANQPSRQPIVSELAGPNTRQPQQTLIVAYTLLLGGEFDLIVNLDGVNEMTAVQGIEEEQISFFPPYWGRQVALTAEEILLAGHIGILRQEQARLRAARETSILRWSALFGLANRWWRERNAAEIIRRNQQLAAVAAGYNWEKHGPGQGWKRAEGLRPEAARFWYRNSVMLARLAALSGADYYHFLQPNQYAPPAKPMSPEERETAYAPRGFYKSVVERGYPLLREFHRDLPGQGVNYFDLTGIFADHSETLYRDKCCHLNARGNELLAAAMVRRMAPALARRGGERPAGPVSTLAAARRPAETGPPAAPDFQVSLAAEGKELRYGRDNCAPADADPWFFLHLIPQDWDDLARQDRERGFDNEDFEFWAAGGRWRGRECAVSIPLPDYPIAALRTGQHIPGQSPLWSVELILPANPDQLRADYAALSAAKPVARDYFDLYVQDYRLLYLRESCAAADTAAAFFLHIVPQDVTDLPEDSRAAGFAHAGFDFARQGGRFDGKCLAAVPLPDYPIKEIRTGQHIPGQSPLWSVQLIAAPDYDQLRADYAALSAVQPAARDYFDLYWRDNRLIYLRESCAAADTAADFFLHIVPEDAADLPADRQAAGFAHAGFAFVRQGGHFDGKCLAAVALPDYPIKEMRTGQYVPGQGDLWSVELMAAP